MNGKFKVPIWLYFFLVLVLFVGWLFTKITDYDTHETGIALVIFLMIFGVAAVSLNVYMREGRHYDNGNSDA